MFTTEDQGPVKPNNAVYRMYMGAKGFVDMFATKWGVKGTDVKEPVKPYKPKPKPAYASYTEAEVAKHNTPDDAWLIIDGKIYDVSGWGVQHPGGDIIYSYAGRDATEVSLLVLEACCCLTHRNDMCI